jgi:hypothetical protein
MGYCKRCTLQFLSEDSEAESGDFSRDEKFAKLVLDYAASEDVIRELWRQVQEEQRAFRVRLSRIDTSIINTVHVVSVSEPGR